MFREMRRFRQVLTETENIEVLKSTNIGILAVDGDDGYPYTVPMNYAYHEGRLYFHGAREGHKADALKRNPKVSFCVVRYLTDDPEAYTKYYESVVVFGRMRPVEDAAEREKITEYLRESAGKHYQPKHEGAASGRALMLELVPDHITGKMSHRLMKERKGENAGFQERSAGKRPGI